MQRKAREVRSALQTKGFQEERRDHWYYFLYHNGKKSNIYTKVSHGETEISTGLCSAMARQIKLTSPQFGEFVDCKLTAEKYVELLIAAKYLSKADEQESG